jgi:hypothetical protein
MMKAMKIYLKNTGTTKAPSFVHVAGSEDPFNDIAQSTAFFNVSFHDWNHGRITRSLYQHNLLQKCGSATRPSFIASGENKPNFQTKPVAFHFHSASMVDLRGDGSTQVVTGNTKGIIRISNIPSDNVDNAVTTSAVIHVFPNPSKDEFIIDLPASNAETIIRLTNLQGKLLSTQMVNGSSFKFGKTLNPALTLYK